MARVNNLPTGIIENVPPETVKNIVTSLRDLYNKGKPQTDAEIQSRIDEYFDFCENSSIRPGIESLSLALHISRVTLFNWSNGNGCTRACQESVRTAKGFISAFIEQATMQGKLNPVSSIFYFKNWFGYRDSISFEQSENSSMSLPTLSREEIAKNYGLDIDYSSTERPEIDF